MAPSRSGAAKNHLSEVVKIGEVPENWRTTNMTPIFRKGAVRPREL
jgi:hypothetical protein